MSRKSKTRCCQTTDGSSCDGSESNPLPRTLLRNLLRRCQVQDCCCPSNVSSHAKHSFLPQIPCSCLTFSVFAIWLCLSWKGVPAGWLRRVLPALLPAFPPCSEHQDLSPCRPCPGDLCPLVFAWIQSVGGTFWRSRRMKKVKSRRRFPQHAGWLGSYHLVISKEPFIVFVFCSCQAKLLQT